MTKITVIKQGKWYGIYRFDKVLLGSVRGKVFHPSPNTGFCGPTLALIASAMQRIAEGSLPDTITLIMAESRVDFVEEPKTQRT